MVLDKLGSLSVVNHVVNNGKLTFRDCDDHGLSLFGK